MSTQQYNFALKLKIQYNGSQLDTQYQYAFINNNI